jgi:hypothetical protein
LIKTLLPNARFLALDSENLGQDWAQKAQEIDRSLSGLSMDLAEESVFLLFDGAPGSIVDGAGHCLIARSVIGPKRNMEGPLKLQDWVQAPVWRKLVSRAPAMNWGELLDECYQEWENLQRQGHSLKAPFMLVIKRRMEPQKNELQLTVELLFCE